MSAASAIWSICRQGSSWFGTVCLQCPSANLRSGYISVNWGPEEVANVPARLVSITLNSSLQSRKAPNGWKKRQVSHLPLRQARKTTWGTTSQPAIPQSLGKLRSKFSSHFQTHGGQEGKWEQPAQIYQGQISPENPDCLMWRDD